MLSPGDSPLVATPMAGRLLTTTRILAVSTKQLLRARKSHTRFWACSIWFARLKPSRSSGCENCSTRRRHRRLYCRCAPHAASAGGGVVARVRFTESNHRRARWADAPVPGVVRGGDWTRFSPPGRALRRDSEEGHPLRRMGKRRVRVLAPLPACAADRLPL